MNKVLVIGGKKKKKTSPYHSADKMLIIALFGLLSLGLVFLFSVSFATSYDKFGYTYFYLLKQVKAAVVGLGLFLFFSLLDYHQWKKFATILLFGTIILLILIFVPGLAASGSARRALVFLGHSIQPSEIIKLVFLIYLASWLEAKREHLRNFNDGLVPFVLVLGLVSALIFFQPDLGTLLIIISSALAVYYVGGARISHVLGLIGVGLLAIFLAFSTGLIKDYQDSRLLCYRNASYDTQDKCYQLHQSLIAVGSGSLFGRGLGESRQKYMYLPEVWGDSIFPIIAEEIGFIFSFLVLALFLFIFYRGLLIARQAPDIFGQTLAVGIITWLAIQTFINIGGMIDLIPMTGVPLPFISQGGTSLMVSLGAMGILVNISKQTRA